jgi:hypothetical protein
LRPLFDEDSDYPYVLDQINQRASQRFAGFAVCGASDLLLSCKNPDILVFVLFLRSHPVLASVQPFEMLPLEAGVNRSDVIIEKTVDICPYPMFSRNPGGRLKEIPYTEAHRLVANMIGVDNLRRFAHDLAKAQRCGAKTRRQTLVILVYLSQYFSDDGRSQQRTTNKLGMIARSFGWTRSRYCAKECSDACGHCHG